MTYRERREEYEELLRELNVRERMDYLARRIAEEHDCRTRQRQFENKRHWERGAVLGILGLLALILILIAFQP